jgi:FAD/FMN-containing dehydrogenase
MPLSDALIKELEDRVIGDVLAPRARGYDHRRGVFNARVKRKPAVIVRCTGAADVIHAVLFAREYGVKVSARAGGHGATGHAVVDDAMLLDLRPMRAVHVDREARTALVQGGALWSDVNHETAPFDLAAAGGTCDMVGVGGHTLGGGWGYLARSMGLAIDTLRSANVVTADGSLVSVSTKRNADLFWALRGGGGGNFGVVTAFEFELTPLSLAKPELYGGSLTWPYEKAAAVLETFCQLLPSVPEEIYLDFSCFGGGGGGAIPSITVVSRLSKGQTDAVLAPILAIPDSPDRLAAVSYTGLLETYAEEIHQGRSQLWKSGFLRQPVGADAIKTMVDHYKRAPTKFCLFFIEPLGGRIASVAPDATAFVHRRELMCATIIGVWTDPQHATRTLDWTRSFYAGLNRARSGGAYVNYADDDLAHWQTAYYGVNYDRLVKLKKQYDPDGLFTFAQSIGT